MICRVCGYEYEYDYQKGKETKGDKKFIETNISAFAEDEFIPSRTHRIIIMMCPNCGALTGRM